MQTAHAPRVASLDPNRIAAISGAIAINGLLLALLVAPMSAPVVVDAAKQIIDYVPIKPRPVPPPPEDPIVVKVEPHTTAPVQPQPVAHERPADPPPVTQDAAQPGDFVVPPGDEGLPTEDTGKDVGPPDDGKPITGAHLEYASNPAPPYPREALRVGDEGTVVLEVLVGVDGRPIEVTVSRSSGHRELDLAAKRQVLANWTFKPATRNGQAVQAIGLVPVQFSLQ